MVKYGLDLKNKNIIVITGYPTSGSGKDTFGSILKENGIPELVSDTTRSPRVGEVDGVNYHFVTKSEFFEREKVEYAEVYEGVYYGVSVDEVIKKLERNDKVFAVLQIDGVKAMKEKFGDVVITICIATDPEIAFKRVIESRKDSAPEVNKRAEGKKMKGDINNIWLADYVINNTHTDMRKNVELFKKIVGIN